MRTDVVFTLTGRDRIGLVDQITGLLLGLGGNVETSRMARLGGAFAVLMLVSLPAEQISSIEEALKTLTAQGYKITISQTEPGQAEAQAGWLVYQIEVEGADHEGIIHEIAHHLSQRGINIESMNTGTKPAPISGTPLFTMSALVAVPPSVAGDDWRTTLDEVGQRLNVEISVEDARD